MASEFQLRVLLVSEDAAKTEAICRGLQSALGPLSIQCVRDRRNFLTELAAEPHLALLDSSISFSRCEELAELLKSQCENSSVILMDDASRSQSPHIDAVTRTPNAHPESVPGIFRTISRFHELQHASRMLERQLLQSQKMEPLGQLMSGVAHEFNNILAVIIGSAELLVRKVSTDQVVRSSIQAIRDAGQRAKEITEQLLTFGRQAAEQFVVFDVQEEIGRSLSTFRRLLGERFQIEIKRGDGALEISGDPTQIQQVLLNLLLNARDAMGAGGKIEISTESRVPLEQGESDISARSFAVLSVRDSGSGMTAETKAKIFEPFFTTKEIGKGTGLGLATVKNIVHRHGGRIEVESELGKGTTFEIWIPMSSASPTVATASPEKSAPHGAGEHVLVVEDDVAVRIMVTEILGEHGYKVSAFDSLEVEAAEAAVRNGVDLLLTDAMMPNITGLELERRLRKILPTLPVIYMSGYPADLLIAQGTLEVGSRFIQKPFGIAAILLGVREALRKFVSDT